MTKIWQKEESKLNPAVTDYIISKNLEEDDILLPYDIAASIAHVKMLKKVGLLKAQESQNLVKELENIFKLHKDKKFILKQNNEDCHTAIESHLTKKLGDTGKKIHMARSRNDQILVAQRLFTKEKIKKITTELLNLSLTLLEFSKKNEFIPMPGYTHTQRAMPSSVGQWSSAFLESLLDDLEIIQSAYDLNNQNPLGSAAGFGTSLNIDREYTSQLLGFKKTQINSIYCQNSRGKIESFTISALSQIMLTLNKIATDLIWFTSSEFNFFEIDKSLLTGSSIMPQKQNLDIMEVLRANTSIIISYQIQVQSTSQNLISGYNKDLKTSKHPLIESLKITEKSLSITNLTFQNLKAKEENLKKALSPEIYATDIVNQLVMEGKPFREAYLEVVNQLKEITENKEFDPIKNIKEKKHIGATGNLQLKFFEKKLKKLITNNKK